MYLNRRTVLVGVFVDLSLQLGLALLGLSARAKVVGPLAHLRHIQPRPLAQDHDVVLCEKTERGAWCERLPEEARVLGEKGTRHRLGMATTLRAPRTARARPKKSAPWARERCCSGARAPPRARNGFDLLVKPAHWSRSSARTRAVHSSMLVGSASGANRALSTAARTSAVSMPHSAARRACIGPWIAGSNSHPSDRKSNGADTGSLVACIRCLLARAPAPLVRAGRRSCARPQPAKPLSPRGRTSPRHRPSRPPRPPPLLARALRACFGAPNACSMCVRRALRTSGGLVRRSACPFCHPRGLGGRVV